MNDDEDDQGSFRWNDPETSKKAARRIKPRGIMKLILTYLARLQEPRNGWEMSLALNMPTITVVPRLCVMRRRGWIKLEETKRPGPSGDDQGAYVITDEGRDVLLPPST